MVHPGARQHLVGNSWAHELPLLSAAWLPFQRFGLLGLWCPGVLRIRFRSFKLLPRIMKRHFGHGVAKLVNLLSI
jgi:hypothetical protein